MTTKLLDISGNQNHGTISGALQTKDGLQFNNSGSSKSYVSLNTEVNSALETLQFVIDVQSTAVSGTFYQHFTFNTRGYRLSICNCGILRMSTSQGGGMTITALQAITVGKHTIQIAIDNANSKVYSTLDGVTTEYAITPYVIGSAETRYLGDYSGGSASIAGTIINHRRYNRLLSSQEAVNYHNSFIKPVYINSFENDATGATSPKGWGKGTGVYKIGELSTAITSPNLPIGTKVLECTSNGTIILNVNLDAYVNNGYISIDRYTGSSWTRYSSNVSSLSISESWFDYSDKKIILTATATDRFANLKIYDGIKQ